MEDVPSGYTKRKSGDVKRIGSPRSKAVVFINTGYVYRDSKVCHAELLKKYPNLKYADIIQRVRGGDWPALMSRLGDLDFRWATKEENTYVRTWVETPKRLNDFSLDQMSKGNQKLVEGINRSSERLRKKK